MLFLSLASSFLQNTAFILSFSDGLNSRILILFEAFNLQRFLSGFVII